MRQADEAFGLAYDEAMDEAADHLEAEAWRRALEGISQPLFKAGQPVIDPATGEQVVMRRYSDPLLALLLKGCKPGKYHARGTQPQAVDPSVFIREIAADDDPPRADWTRRRG